MNYYEKWIPGDKPPEISPENCEALGCDDEWSNGWEMCSFSSQWHRPKRWPVTEDEWRTNRYCEAFDISIPEGYELVRWDCSNKPEDGEYALLANGKLGTVYFSDRKFPIVRKNWIVKTYWITKPTDEDAKLRPEAEFSNCENFSGSVCDTLLHVLKQHGEKLYLSSTGLVYVHCRIKQSELSRLRGEKG